MSKRNQLTPLQREMLAPLVGKIATGFRYEPSPNRKLFSGKLSVRLRPLDVQDSELFLGLHYKLYGPDNDPKVALNLGINLMTTERIEHQSSLGGLHLEEQESLAVFLRQPLTGLHLTPAQSLVLIFAHQTLLIEWERDDNQELHLAWALG
ncbi:MAG: hypothetical protein ACO1RX_13445 [Candidatus Sericytochromatia bacterium]